MFTEEKEFRLRFSLSASFPDDYSGEEDGYQWLREWEEVIKPGLIKVVFAHLRGHPGWRCHVRSRGISPEDEIEVVLEKELETRP